MLISVAGWLVCFTAGVALQRRLRDPQHASHVVFLLVLWVLSPLTVVYAYTTVSVRPAFVAAFACVIAAAWVTVLMGTLWGRLAGRDRGEAGTMAYATVMGNTAILGYPLATIAFGGPGLALAVVFTEFQFLIPTPGVILGLARRYAGPGSRMPRVSGAWQSLRTWFVNPPVIVGAVAVALRLLGVDITALVEPVGPTVGLVIGFVGFFQLGLAVSLEPLRHGRGDLWRVAMTLVLRSAVAPLILLAIGWLAGVHIPGVFLMLAATPVAFFTMVVSAVFDLDRELARLLVAVSTSAAILVILVWQLVAG